MPAPLLIVGPTGDSGKYLVTWVNSEYLLLRQYIHHCSAPIILNIGCKFREKKLNPQIFNHFSTFCGANVYINDKQ